MAKLSPSHEGNRVLVNLGKSIKHIRLLKGYSKEAVALASELDR